jgi:hypothetical protein
MSSRTYNVNYYCLTAWTASTYRRHCFYHRTVGKITEKLAKSRNNQNNLLKIEIVDYEFVISISKNKMAFVCQF